MKHILNNIARAARSVPIEALCVWTMTVAAVLTLAAALQLLVVLAKCFG